ncbi:hypothetical protein XHV734_2429 [Xanthomonas hortorum pv. vitians]|nr:hypothetical protein XHV734_2429 [Xanthomonas hortorum pv. vitians]
MSTTMPPMPRPNELCRRSGFTGQREFEMNGMSQTAIQQLSSRRTTVPPKYPIKVKPHGAS